MRVEFTPDYRPHKYQVEIHNNLRKARYSVLVCHRRFGKTTSMVYQLGAAALQDKRKDARYAYLSPFLKQSKDIAWDILKRQFGGCHGVKVSEIDSTLTFPHGPRIRLYGADNADALRGGFFDGIVIDEVADIKPGVWEQIIFPALQDRKGWAVFIGTPKGVNTFHELYTLAQSQPGWWAGMYRADETQLPWLNSDTLAQARAMMPDAAFRQEFLCDFNASADNTLIPIDVISDACRRAAHPQAAAGMAKVVGVDVARFGGDRSVILKRQGFIAFEPTVLKGLDNMEVVGRVAAVITEWQPDAVFVDAGRGEGVIDRLRQLGHQVIEVNFGGRPTNPRYSNKRSEMWDTMAQWIKSEGLLPNNPELKTDLAVPTYRYDGSNRMVLESKDEIKARGMRSPDLADALAITFAFPVSPQQRSRAGRHTVDYDPLARSHIGGHQVEYDPYARR